MKVQYDLEGGQLNQPRCSKYVLGAILLVVLMLGSALATICFQQYWEEQHDAVPSELTTVKAFMEINLDQSSTDQPTTTTTTATSTTVEASTDVQDSREINYIEINLDEQGLEVNVNHENGSLVSITESSSDLLKEFVGLIMVEAFAAMRELQEANNAKHVDIPELPPVEASTEEIWSWSTQENHDGFRIRFDNGEWSFGAVSREESPEDKSSESESKEGSEEVKEEGEISTEAPEEIWSWSSQGFNGFRINFTDGKWSFETVSRDSEEESDISEEVSDE